MAEKSLTPNQRTIRAVSPYAVPTFSCGPGGVPTGWRLPSIHELTSLLDPLESFPTLPNSHPFLDVQNTFYWAATTAVFNPSAAWLVQFGNAGVGTNFKTSLIFNWCVRGGSPGPEKY